MASGNSAMVLETGSGWTRGLRNLLRAELGEWFGTRQWWVQILIWTACTNLIYLMAALGLPDDQPASEAIMLFNIFMGLSGAIGVTIVMQLSVIAEKRNGTAAWLLSKPVSRQAFVIAKLIANALGILVTMVLAQGLIAYLITGFVVGEWLPITGFLAGLGAHFAHILFYLTLTLMLGVLFERPAPVIGIPMGFLFAQNFLAPQLAQKNPMLANLFPWGLSMPLNGIEGNGVAGELMAGNTPVLLALYVALACAVTFVTVAVIAFRRQEL